MKANSLYSSMDDGQVVSEFNKGNNEAMGVLYNRYNTKVYHKCLTFTGDPDDAYDLAQDILIKVFGKISSFKGESKFSTWLYASAHNHCLDYVRKKGNIQFATIDECQEIHDEPMDTDAAENRENKLRKVKELMKKISCQDRQLLILKYQQEASVKELQEMFNLSMSAIKMRLQRARHKVIQHYNDGRETAAA